MNERPNTPDSRGAEKLVWDLVGGEWMNLDGESYAKWDITLESGRKVDVKCTKYGDLAVPPRLIQDDTVYVLVLELHDGLKAHGWITGEQLWKLGRDRNGGFYERVKSIHWTDDCWGKMEDLA